MNIDGVNITEVYVYRPPRTYKGKSGLYQTERPYKEIPKENITEWLERIKKEWIELDDYVIKETKLYVNGFYMRSEKYEYCCKLDKFVNAGEGVSFYELPSKNNISSKTN